jgi:hypothetical protein
MNTKTILGDVLKMTSGVALFFSIVLPFGAQAQEKMTKEQMKEKQKQELKMAVESKSYEFKATQAYSDKGRTINLTSLYGITVTEAKVISDLPFYGTAYGGAGYGSNEGPIQFESTDFGYTSEPGKKGGWTITIKPNDKKEILSMILNISNDGYTTVSVTSSNRSLMRYNGTVEKYVPKQNK